MWNIKKILTSIILLIFFSQSSAHSEVVKKVEVIGNERISTETIIIFGDIAIGKDYKSSDINLLIKKLYDTTFFSDLSVEFKNNKLSITVKENPIIDTIIFTGEKAEKFKDKIKEFLILREKGPFVESDIKTDINQIMSF